MLALIVMRVMSHYCKNNHDNLAISIRRTARSKEMNGLSVPDRLGQFDVRSCELEMADKES